ncbi:MAG TPA: DUF3267 domain-containing protein [Ktedonobacteraceae bacterium]|nr:DUF3267 domain-containing protein [Ktedonobacteraceae bacterium]
MTIIDRFRPRRRAALQAAADAGQLRQVDELALLNPEQLLPLARLSLLLFVLGGIFFIVLNLGAYIWRTGQHGASLNGGEVLLWIVINVLGYVIMLPLHEFLHGVAIAFLGGRPHYGARLPFALYCGAKDQAFPRNYYIVIALAPFVLISLAGIIFTLLAPGLAPYTLLATVGNVSGAAGDLLVVQRQRMLPASVLVEDLETGYRAWEVMPGRASVTIEAAEEK